MLQSCGDLPGSDGLAPAVGVEGRVVTVAFDQLLLLFLARVHDELETGVVTVGEEVQFDHVVLRDEQPAAFDLAAEVARTPRIVQGWRPVVHLKVSFYHHLHT